MIADKSDGKRSFIDELASTFTSARNSGMTEMRNNSAGRGRVNTTDDGFRSELRESQDTHNQARHYVGGFIAAAHFGEFFGRRFMNDLETPGMPDYASDTAMPELIAFRSGVLAEHQDAALITPILALMWFPIRGNK